MIPKIIMLSKFFRDVFLVKSKDEILDDLEDLFYENERLKDENEKLKRELEKYQNSNTPSSANKHLQSNTSGQKSRERKLGAPKGHKGNTRIYPDVEVEIIDEHKCPHCHSSNVFDYEIIKKTFEEIPQPVTPTVKKYEIHKI